VCVALSLHSVAASCSLLQGVLQVVAVCSIVLQCVAVTVANSGACDVIRPFQMSTTCVLHCVAVCIALCCSVFQGVVLCYSVLQ